MLAAFSLLAFLGMACGISLGAGQDETEIFKRLTVEGQDFPGADMKMTLEYAQQYDVLVAIACDIIAKDDTLASRPNVTLEPTATLAPDVAPTDIPVPRPRPTIKNKIVNLFNDTLPVNEAGGPVGEATPVPGVIERDFQAPGFGGRYEVRCFTPQDPNNVISSPFTIIAFPTQTPMPGLETPS